MFDFKKNIPQEQNYQVGNYPEPEEEIYLHCLFAQKDLKLEIDKYTEEHKIKASMIVTCVGALTKATIRMAGAREIKHMRKILRSFHLLVQQKMVIVIYT